LVEKTLKNSSLSVEIRILKALKFSGGKLRPYSTAFLAVMTNSTGFSSCDQVSNPPIKSKYKGGLHWIGLKVELGDGKKGWFPLK